VDLEGLGPFADPGVLILTSLAAGPNHGYGLIKDIEDLSGVRLGPGTLYGALGRLEERGLVEPVAAHERRPPDHRRRCAGAARLPGARGDRGARGLRRLAVQP
jgi:hypothetical protein